MTHSLHLVARLGGCGLLFDAGRVDSVVEVATIVPAPGAGSAVMGLAAMRSRVATVIDIRRLLGVPPRVAERRGRGRHVSRAVVTAVDGHLYAIAVDTLEDVNPYEIAPPPPGLGGGADWSFVQGVAEGGGETLLSVDIDELIARANALDDAR
jgi:purine-binding chemotaxis protein CheW